MHHSRTTLLELAVLAIALAIHRTLTSAHV
jgi:hypothetical protein